MMMNNILYITDSNELAESKAKELAEENKLEFFSFSFSRESMDTIMKLYKDNDNFMVFIAGINKSPVACSLLKPLEDCNKNCWCVGSAKNYDVPVAIKARFECINLISDSCSEAVKGFLSGNNISKDSFSSIEFYRKLAEELVNKDFDSKTLYRLNLINDIVDDIMLTTNNILWDELYYKLRGEWCA